MFTINIYLRFALIGILLIGGIIMAVFLGFWYAFPLILTGLILLAGYILLGTVQSAATIMQDGTNFEGADERLKLTLNPKWLYVTNRAYYYLLKGTISQGLGRMDEAEEWLKNAQSLNLPTDNEKAAVQLQLAGIAAQRQKWNLAKMYLKNAKDLNVTQQELKEQMKQFEKALGQQGQMKAAQRMGMVQKGGFPLNPGSKRRRPKMR
jgi:tetratricopeptide (TPR) repeat protein